MYIIKKMKVKKISFCQRPFLLYAEGTAPPCENAPPSSPPLLSGFQLGTLILASPRSLQLGVRVGLSPSPALRAGPDEPRSIDGTPACCPVRTQTGQCVPLPSAGSAVTCGLDPPTWRASQTLHSLMREGGPIFPVCEPGSRRPWALLAAPKPSHGEVAGARGPGTPLDRTAPDAHLTAGPPSSLGQKEAIRVGFSFGTKAP